MSIEMGDAGSTGFNQYPPVVIKITQPNGEADQRGNKITLPVELNSNNAAYKTLHAGAGRRGRLPGRTRSSAVSSAKSPFLPRS